MTRDHHSPCGHPAVEADSWGKCTRCAALDRIDSLRQKVVDRSHLPTATDWAVRNVLDERRRQVDKWGPQEEGGARGAQCGRSLVEYHVILSEEVGELAEAVLHDRFGGPAAAELYKEAVQTAAVALAIVEALHLRDQAPDEYRRPSCEFDGRSIPTPLRGAP